MPVRRQLLRVLQILVLASVAVLCTGTAWANFGFRKSITIDRTKVGVSGTSATTISNYPLLVSITTDTDLETVANGGDVTSSSGYDIVFRALDTTTCNGASACTLSHELVTYTATTGELIAWVRLPKVNTISAGSDTVIYMYYGDSSITTSTARKTDVWTNYAAVWHLDEATVDNPSTSTMYDSSSNAYNGTATGMNTITSVTGKSHKALDFDNDDDRVNTSNFLSGATALTAEAWVNSTEDYGETRVVAKTNTDTASSTNFVFSMTIENTLGVFEGVVTHFGTGGAAPTKQTCAYSFQNNGWRHVVARWDGSTVKIYVNGALQSSEAGCNYAKTGTLNTTTTPVTIGGAYGINTSTAFYKIDEVRLSTIDRDADYIKTTYNNQNNVATFYTKGAEAAAPLFAVDFLGGHAVRLPNGQVLVGWETGLEQDNLGFHVLREEGGTVKQITRDLIGGSLLRAMVGGNESSPYFWVDPHSWGAGPVRYYVDDVDASGIRTRHGPLEIGRATAATGAMLQAYSAEQAIAPAAWAASVGAKLDEPIPSTDLSQVARSMESSAASATPFVKLGVVKDGWIRVLGTELAQAGFPLGISSNQVAVLKDGASIARLVADGGDGTLDASDALEFWGLREPGIYANEGIYAVSWGSFAGKPLTHAGGTPPAMSALGPAGFTTFEEYAEKKFYLAALNNGAADNFLGPVIRPTSLTVPLPAPHALVNAEPRLLVTLRGVSLLPHDVELNWNGLPLGSVAFENREQATFESVVPEVLAENLLTLTGKAGDVDYTAIESARLYYQRAYKANGEQLRFTALGGDRVTLGGFAAPGIRVLDVTYPAAPVELAVLEFPVNDEVSGKVAVPGTGTRELYAFTKGAETPVGYLQPIKASALRASALADLVIVSHPAFLDHLAPLVAQREREGLRVIVEDVEALYDDFGRGRKDPEAIREAMRFLAQQGKTPKYLLLVGDGSFDPHNYLGKNVVDYIPVATMNTVAFETAYDGYYGDLNEDGRAEIAVGRLPARTPEDLDIAVEKLLRYAAAPPEWPLDVLLVAGEDPTIDVALMGRAALDPEPLTVREQLLTALTTKEELLMSLSESSRMVTYIGHGSTSIWGNGQAFSLNDAVSLERTGAPSVFTLMTCLNGFFHDVYSESLAEGLLRAPHGAAVSVWAAPAMADSAALGPLYRAFVAEWASGRARTLGKVALAAKLKVTPSETERSMSILGDPSLRLALPPIAKTRADALSRATEPTTNNPVPNPTNTTTTPKVPSPQDPGTRPGVTPRPRGFVQATHPRPQLVGATVPPSVNSNDPSQGAIDEPKLTPSASGEANRAPEGPEANGCRMGARATPASSWLAFIGLVFAGARLRRRRLSVPSGC
ncbi:MAG: C25 family cysteine peptidase [Polyangiaceae bacterium]|nr:C25 family cysteine peptidase [Polyangiaceae bacterium]